jgi:hypothetical protein
VEKVYCIKIFLFKNILKKQYPESLYLPVWHIRDKKEVRLLSYQSDIVSKINWDNIDISEIADSLQRTIKDHIVRGVDYRYFLGETYLSEMDEYEKENIEGGDEYIISQILSEYIYNPFYSVCFC